MSHDFKEASFGKLICGVKNTNEVHVVQHFLELHLSLQSEINSEQQQHEKTTLRDGKNVQIQNIL